MKRRTAKLLMVLLMVLLFVAGLAVASITKGNKLAIYAVAFVAIVISLFIGRYLRCPGCCRMPRNWLFAEYCPYCGEYLGD